MNKILKSITLNERSYNVSLLHKILNVLAYPVEESEVAQGKALKDTLNKVRALQAQLNVPVNNAILVDENTSLAVTRALKERGLLTASRSFTVSGAVKLRTGEVKKRQQLIAFDLDLRGVAVYRTVKNLVEIQKIGGFEFLGEAVSDNLGNYQITFYDWQYGQAERKKADVVVYAIERKLIIGRSRMVNSEDYSDKGLVRDLDIFIERDDRRTEYEILMGNLDAFLKESKTGLAEIAKSQDQLSFTASELDVDLSRIKMAASAELLTNEKDKRLSHELFYGIGRQSIRLSWPALYKKQEEELRNAIARSMNERIIRDFQDKEITAFLHAIQQCSSKHMLDDNGINNSNSLNVLLKNALPEEKQRLSFVNALRNFKGSDFRDFWKKHLPASPEFKGNPQLIKNLLLTQQLTLLSGNHQTLVTQLQVNRKLKSLDQLIQYEKKEWDDLIKKTGVPDFIEGKNEKERRERYCQLMQNLLNAACPTPRIALMIKQNKLPIKNIKIANIISKFLKQNNKFDFAGSRIHEFKKEIKRIAGKDYDEVNRELKLIQRVFQVSPNPEVMTALMNMKMPAAHTIANIPLKSFIKSYGKALGGDQEAFAVHQRASHISTRSEMIAMHMMEYSHGLLPKSTMDDKEYAKAMQIIQNNLPNPTPNYAALFGSPDICECKHCRSVYSAAAYFVDLLRFLENSAANIQGHTPYDILIGKKVEGKKILVQGRRPDLAKLPLTCENTDTIIPYIDLVNEVMEYYTAHDSLTNFEGYDTGEATAEELRANPQNFNLEAYRRLNDAKYPFTLPYHQPLDVIRTYCDHLKVSRHEALKAMNPQLDARKLRAIEAESLKISPEEYKILAREDFDGTVDSTPVYNYFGYDNPLDFENMQNEKDQDENPRGIRVFLERTGLAYTDLVELVKTKFINPFQNALFFLTKFSSCAGVSANLLYTKLAKIASGQLNPLLDIVIMKALTRFNNMEAKDITPIQFGNWVKENFDDYCQVITLHEPDSKCQLETTQLKIIKNIYENIDAPGITNWSEMHRFIRLWRKLGWTIHETDLMLTALGDVDITTETISKLGSVSWLHEATKRPLNELAVLWGNIDTCGDKSLYKKLFLNKAVQKIDDVFKPNAWGEFLQDDSIKLAEHKAGILDAFRITEKDLAAIMEAAQVIDGGEQRNLSIDADALNIQNLSIIYRYVVLAKALKMKIADLCIIIGIFSPSPFSIWNMDFAQSKYVNVSPQNTCRFFKLALSTKQAGFKSSLLEDIFNGSLAADSKIGIDKNKILKTAKTVRDTFNAIEKEHPEESELPLTMETLTAKLSLTFQSEIIDRFTGILQGTALFETKTDANLDITIPDALANKYSYIKGSGWLSCTGVMTDSEQSTLKDLAPSISNFVKAIDELYTGPDTFISVNLKGIFGDLAEAKATLIEHPTPSNPVSLDTKLEYVYKNFMPILKAKLRKDAVTQHIAVLIGLSEGASAILLAQDIEGLISELSVQGFSATYYSDPNLTTSAFQRTDKTIDFAWGAAAPDPALLADNFSARWEAYVAAPASGEYTLRVDVAEADESFKIYLDNEVILEKASGDTSTSWDKLVALNAAQMHLLRLEYAETSQNAGIRLQWVTKTTAPEVVSESVAYPAAVLDAFAEMITVYHRAAKFISLFKLSETELNHLIKFPADFGNINFKALTPDHWRRINDYTSLRNAVPQAKAFLIDVFVLANISNPAPAIEDLKILLFQATAWDEADLGFLVDNYFNLRISDFKNEIALNRMREVIRIATKTGLSAQTIAKWGAVETSFNALHDTAQLIKNTVKAKYEEEDWLKLAKNMSDKIRENQKQALISYLLMQEPIKDWGAKDADSLFEYFLIDVQMGACMDTSRIVQANAAVQMFVNRCLLNLEKDISPDAIDKDRWEWMKNYRVWEANRKVFLYPENWLEPEWRNNRSEFFKELESYLVQNDITDRSVEQAFRNYLTSLNEVANLEVCGMYQEDYDDGKLKYLHVFARTHNAPYKFFYRTWNEYRKWSAWEKVQVDIRSVENGDKSGVHLIPVVWKKRLFLFWPEFMEVQKESSQFDKTKDMEDIGTSQSMESLKARKYWEIHLAWSEYVDGKWSPKEVSNKYSEQTPDEFLMNEKDLLFIPTTWWTDNHLYISIIDKYWDEFRGGYYIPDIQSPIHSASSGFRRNGLSDSGKYRYAFSKRQVDNAMLELMDDVYLQNQTSHKLLPVDTLRGLDITLDSPFFFSDNKRTYFVRPVDIKITEWIKNPNYRPPLLVEQYGLKSDKEATGDSNPFKSKSKYLYSDKANIEAAFGRSLLKEDKKFVYTSRNDIGLEFHTFYHPFSNEYVTRLNQGGLRGLTESDTEIPSDEGAIFEDKDTYDPNFCHGLIQKPLDFDKRTYYKENVCFDPYGANSLHNWELFFHAPLYIATRLSKNGKYEEAMKWFHYIFDPTTDEMPGESEISRYWKVLPFKTTPVERLEDWFRQLNRETDPSSPDYHSHSELSDIVSEWRDNPFDPHLVASNRPLAYMKHVVIKYVENLIAWGDSLFRQFTMESVNEALQIYVIANHILGPRPEFVPKRGEIKTESYYSLQDKWDDFSNALVELENIFPYSSEVCVSSDSTGTNLLGIGSALYFCIPANEELLDLWNTVFDRLDKIRHCKDIEGVERKLALFAPPISPEALIQAVSQGLSLGSILADLSSPPPIYRFIYLIQKVNEFCSDVKALGSAVLAALEKKDAEELSRLRASHETQMLELVTAIRERQVLDAKAYKENLLKARETAGFRLQHYIDLLGNESSPPRPSPTISATLTVDSQLPADTNIVPVQTDVDESLVDSDESGVKLIPKEKEDIDKSNTAKWYQTGAGAAETLGAIAALFPNIEGKATPLGVGVGTWWGGQNLGQAASAIASGLRTVSQYILAEATLSAKMASYIRREQDWTLQANLASKEIIQLDKQITSADIRIQVAEKELENHKKQIENAKEVELFLKDKFTNQELYQWMKEQLFAVYKQSYNMAYDMAKKAEKAYKYETGAEMVSFIQYGYWDNTYQGLMSGERLQLALRQMEKSFLEDNRRELELTKNISLAIWSPLELQKLKETGRCYLNIPEELFDLDFQGHYFRRIKAVRISVPCVAGPYTSVNCTLRLLKNTIRVNTAMNEEGEYEHNNEEGIWTDDDRFRSSNIIMKSIATSTGQNDAGMFELNFRDERYLPFEGAGAITEWKVELTGEKDLRQFDYSTISDVIIHLSYTAREDAGAFKEKSIDHIKKYLENSAEISEEPLMRLISLKHEFPTEWHRFLHPSVLGNEQVLNFTIGKERMPFFAQHRSINVMKLDVLARTTKDEAYYLTLEVSGIDENNTIVVLKVSDIDMPVTMSQNDQFGNLQKVQLTVEDTLVENILIDRPISLRIKYDLTGDFKSLATDPDEIKDILLVLHYNLSKLENG